MFVFKSLSIFIVSLFLTTSAFAEGNYVAPMEVPGSTRVSPSEAKTLFDEGVIFVDVRKASDFEAGRIPDAVHLDLKQALSEETLGAEVEKNQKVVFYCNGKKCKRSPAASAKAVSWGYSQVYYFRTGFPGWKAAGYPVE